MKLVADTNPLVIAIDPGLTTGWALIDLEDGGLAAGETEGRINFYRTFESLVGNGRPVEVVAEKFTINTMTARKSPQPDALYILGAVEYLCDKLGIPFSLQTPAQAKSFATDEKLRALGWYSTTGEGHSNDARRHLLVYLVRSRHPAGQALAKALVAKGAA